MDNQATTPSATTERSSDQQLREMNEALLISSIHQHEMTEQSQNTEAALRALYVNLQSQTDDLSRFNRLAVGRELRMIDLKKEVNELCHRQGEAVRYSLKLEQEVKPTTAESPTLAPSDGLVPSESLAAIEQRSAAALNLMEDAVHSREAMERANVELADLHRRKDEFLAMLSHELRNPLAPISNAVYLLRLQKDEDEIQQKARAIIERQVAQLARIVDDLMEVSRITTGRVQLRHDQVAVSGIVERSVETASPLLKQYRHELTVSVPQEPIWLNADAARLEQVVVNLLTNAAKYTDEGGHIWLTVAQEREECVLRVRDTGVGIAPALLPRIFDLFTQAERSLDRSQGGLGIGLALVQRLVAMHGGRVEAHSSLGHGSEFVVRLPLMPSSASPSLAPVQIADPTGPSRRILVVDDNVDAATTLTMLLNVAGHEVRSVHDGLAALEAALEFRPDVVLLDIGLPGMNGYEVAARMRQQPSNEKIVLIAVTGYGSEADREHSKEVGFDHHLVKPVEFSKVESILATVLPS